MSNQTDVKFLHFRFFNENGDIQSRGGMTFAYQSVNDGQVRYALARCHSRDAYVKSQGRLKAAGRLKSDRLAKNFAGTEREFQNFLESSLSYANEEAFTYNEDSLILARKYNAKTKHDVVKSASETGLVA